MARVQLPSLHLWRNASATPARTIPEPSELDGGPLMPCDFMPQPQAPMMVLSSTPRRTHKSVDDRAVRLLRLEDLNGSIGSLQEENEIDLCERPNHGSAYPDINQTPRTPPKTPITPTTDTSLSSTFSHFSAIVFTKIELHLRLSPHAFHPLQAALLFFVICILIMALLGRANVKAGLEGVAWKTGHVWYLLAICWNQSSKVSGLFVGGLSEGTHEGLRRVIRLNFSFALR
ncbi:Nn.00g084330.m01.CDS01 [Neocucurbitaria sp. VM-36]